MYLVYFDETGNTGTNFEDAQQQVFVLGALVVPEAIWQDLEKDLQAAVDKAFPQPRPEDFEIHGGAMRNGQGYFRGFSVADRMAFRDRWLAMARQHGETHLPGD